MANESWNFTQSLSDSLCFLAVNFLIYPSKKKKKEKKYYEIHYYTNSRIYLFKFSNSRSHLDRPISKVWQILEEWNTSEKSFSPLFCAQKWLQCLDSHETENGAFLYRFIVARPAARHHIGRCVPPRKRKLLPVIYRFISRSRCNTWIFINRFCPSDRGSPLPFEKKAFLLEIENNK